MTPWSDSVFTIKVKAHLGTNSLFLSQSSSLVSLWGHYYALVSVFDLYLHVVFLQMVYIDLVCSFSVVGHHDEHYLLASA